MGAEVLMEERSSFLPAYYRLAEDLRARIESGELKPGSMLPSVAQLAARYGVSTMTVRQGLALLAKRGYLKTVQGKGSFVTAPRRDLLALRLGDSFLLGESKDVQVKLLELRVVPASPEVAEKLGVEEGAKVIAIRRLLLREGVPVALDLRFLPYLKGVPLLEKELAYAAFPDLVAQHAELFCVKSTLEVSARLLAKEEAEALAAPAGSPGLCLEQTIFAPDGRPVGWSRMVCRGDRFTLKAVSHPF